MNDNLFIIHRTQCNTTCKICQKSFKTLCALAAHLNSAHKINSKSYYDTYFKNETDDKCIECGKQTKWFNLGKGYRIFCSLKCCNNNKEKLERKQDTIKKSSMEKYGVKHYTQSEEYKKKRAEACKAKWGVSSYFATKEFSEQRKKHNQETFGVDYTFQREDVKEKIKQTKKERYNDEFYTNREKAQKTCIELYNDPHYSNREQCWKTFEEKYGTKNIFTLDEIKEKRKETLIKNYGSTSYNNRELWKENCIKKYGSLCFSQIYLYNNTYFSSSWELAYYIWLKDHNIVFEYQPDTIFSYEYDGTNHEYCPDFKINEDIIEIKGTHFFKDGKMICPYDRNKRTNEENEYIDGLFEAKHQCMIKNGVKIITDCSKFLKYINTIYGIRYLQNFRR